VEQATASLQSAANCKFIAREETEDVYYYDPLRSDLKPTDDGRLSRCFRLRRKGGHSWLTYKVDVFRGDVWMHSDENETLIDDHDSAGKVIAQLGLKELVRVVMTKTQFENERFAIVIESVQGLGFFLEVESKANVSASGVDAEKERIRSFVASLGLNVGEELNAGKPELLLAKMRDGRH
jgi:adenylate cyclase class 2